MKRLKDAYPRLVLAVGRLVKYKGFDVLIEAAKSIDATVLIVGDGVERANLQTVIDTAGLQKRVQMIGALDERQLIIHLHAADVFALSSISNAETFGIAQLEAMAAGTPVLASDIPAFKAVLEDGQFGKLFKNTNAADLASKLSLLLESEEQRKELAKAGIARAAQFDWANIVSRIESVYETVVQPGRKVLPDISGQLLGQISRPTKVAEL